MNNDLLLSSLYSHLVVSKTLSNKQPYNCQVNTQPINQFMFHDNSYTCRIILSLIRIQHIIKQLTIAIAIIHKWHTQDSNPVPFIITKYSQPLELVLFHVISPNIKCHKSSITRIY